MKSTGIVRKIDSLGRIVIPKELRDTLGIEIRDSLEIYMDADAIMLKTCKPACIICGEAGGLVEYKGKKLCRKCINELEK